MPRTKNSKNKSYFHYKITNLNTEDGIMKHKYYLTLYNIAQDFKCTTRCINDRMKMEDQTKTGKRRLKFDNYIVEKISKPRYKLICIDEELIE